jgi:hypothetical protein
MITNTPNLFPLLYIRDHVSHIAKQQVELVVYILMFSDKKREIERSDLNGTKL